MVLGKKKKEGEKSSFYAVDVLEALQRDILSQPRSPLFHARAKIELETTIKRALLGLVLGSRHSIIIIFSSFKCQQPNPHG